MANWAQDYDPLHAWPLSTLVAALPVLSLFFVLLVLRARVWVAALDFALPAEFETELRAQADSLSLQECKKLRLLVARRWKTVDHRVARELGDSGARPIEPELPDTRDAA